MKKLELLLIAIALIAVSSCKKESLTQPAIPTYVKSIAGEFIANDGNLTFKADPITPVGVSRIWEMYKSPSADGVYSLVNGDEFIENSTAFNFWHNPLNNPVTYPVGTTVMSNLTPIENLKIVTKTLDANNKIAYLGVHNFFPAENLFPLNIVGRRLGDVLVINTGNLKAVPGYSLAVTVSYKLSTIDVNATAMAATSTFAGWPTYVYTGSKEVITDIPVANTGNVVIYDAYDKKISEIVIKVKDANNNINMTIPVTSPALGNYLAITLKTDKSGWYDSSNIGVEDKNILVVPTELSIDSYNQK